MDGHRRHPGSCCASHFGVGKNKQELIHTLMGQLCGKEILDDEQAIAYSTHGRHVLDSIRVVDTIRDALTGCVLSFAMTARDGLYRTQAGMTAEEAARRTIETASSGEIAFVFGDFRRGLGLSYLYEDSPGKEALSNSMMSYWTELAYHGDPGTGRDGSETPWLAWGTDGQRSIVLDTPDDKGISMTSDEVTLASIKHALTTDPEIPTQRERCLLYVRSFRRGGDMDTDEYEALGAEGCAQFDPEELAAG